MSDKIKEELLAIKGNKEFLTAEAVVTWAKAHPDSALHSQFTWNLRKAAREHWLLTARHLIALHVVYADGARRLISLSIDRTRPAGGYRSIDDVVQVPSLYEVMLEDALRELKRIEAKYQKLVALKPVWEAAERLRVKRGKSVEGKNRATA
jgi:hypothetical protein